jgi:uncharacterized protein YdcH (DUF465 family)
MIQTHPIVAEFPEFTDKIKNLYQHNEEFQVLMNSYHLLDVEIYHIEKGEILETDEALTHKRKDRVFLKDQIYELLK